MKIGKIIIVFIEEKIKIKELWEIYVKKGLTGRLREHVRLRGHIGGLDDSNINVARKDPQEHIGKALEEEKIRVERVIFTESDYTTDYATHPELFRYAKEFAHRKKGIVITVPRMIQLFEESPYVIENTLQATDIDSAEYVRKEGDGILYVVGHGVGPLSIPENFEEAWKYQNANYGFMPIKDKKGFNELVDMAVDVREAKEQYHYRSTFNAIKIKIPRGYKFVSLNASIGEMRGKSRSGELVIFERGHLTREQYVRDDRNFAMCGCMFNRSKLADWLLSTEDIGSGKRRTEIYHGHRIAEMLEKMSLDDSLLEGETFGRPFYINPWLGMVDGLDPVRFNPNSRTIVEYIK